MEQKLNTNLVKMMAHENFIATSEIISTHGKVEFKFIHMYIFNHHFSAKDFYRVQLDPMQFIF